MWKTVVLCVALVTAACAKTDPGEEAKRKLLAIAEYVLAENLQQRPEQAYFLDLKLERHDGLTDITPEGLARFEAVEDQALERLNAIDAAALKGTPEWVLWGQLKEYLEAAVGVRVCRGELWTVNHMGSFYSFLPDLAERQPVGTPKLRQEALARWGKIAAVVDADIANLRIGIGLGYLSPKAATKRVIAQVDGLAGIEAAASPLNDPARRDEDAAFKASFTEVIAASVIPALRKYRDFLATEYLAAAREDRAVSANPNGRDCFAASYRAYTTMKRTPEEVFALGQALVEANQAAVISLGKEHYGADDFAAAIKAAREDEANQIHNAGEAVAIYKSTLARAEASSAQAFAEMPPQPAVIEPYPDFLQGTGMSARYEQATEGRPGVFRFDPKNWNNETLASAEIVTVHEAYPGHHLQIATAMNLTPVHEVQKLIFNSAYVEGWARYAEALAEELDVYSTHHAKILRRSWPARGIVIDAGFNALGWSAEEAKAFARESGRFQSEAEGEVLIDRISVIPAQLTAYDSGAAEIFALRREAEAALGDRFDLKAFHRVVLGNGVVPLWMLRQAVEEWIASERAAGSSGGQSGLKRF